MDIDIKELIKAATEGLNLKDFKGDVVGVKLVENEFGNIEPGGIGIQINNGPAPKATPNSKKGSGKKDSDEKPEKPRETMTFKRKGSVTEPHLQLLYMALTKEQWIDGNDADFKALFSGSRDEDCELVWLGKYGKGTLVELFKQMAGAGLIEVPQGFTLSAILEGHFKDKNGQWLTGLDKGDAANDKAMPVIKECIKQLKTDPQRLLNGDYEEDDDFRSEYDRFDQQDMHWHKQLVHNRVGSAVHLLLKCTAEPTLLCTFGKSFGKAQIFLKNFRI